MRSPVTNWSSLHKFLYFGVFVEKFIGQEQCGNLFWPCHSINYPTSSGLLTCLIRIQIIKTCINFLYLNTIRKADIFVKYWRYIEPNCIWSDLKRGADPHTFLNIIKQTVLGWRDWAHSQYGNAGAREDQEVPQVGHHDSDELNKAIMQIWNNEF